ncbi:MAG: glycosyltransferase [Chitinispirillaceae bacterium]|nr:glycosyltransferase [Chitinispirillaceae bacterium]
MDAPGVSVYNLHMPPAISIIVCSRKGPSFALHERNLRKTVGTASCEYIRIDNRDNRYSLSAAYNEGVRRSRGGIAVFVHEDVFFMEGGWGEKLVGKFKDPTIGLVGVAGTEYLFADEPGWVAAGRPFIHGHVIHELENGEVYNLTVFSWEKEDIDVVAVDGLFFAVRKELFGTVGFDETVFDGFHFYDIDLCMQIRRTHRCIVTWDLLVKHQSGGSFDEHWKRYALRFIAKYRSELPASCAATVPDRTRRIPFENYNLKNRAPQVTIV